MKYAIEYQNLLADTLIVGARKKQTYNTFIFVHHCTVLIRLGKNEIPVTSGQSFWLPIHCLNAMTVLQGAHVSVINFSVRTRSILPKNAGFIDVDPLIIGLIGAINSNAIDLNADSDSDWHGSYGRLLRCLRDQLSTRDPVIEYHTKLSAAISTIEHLGRKETGDHNYADFLDKFGISSNAVAEQLQVRHWVRQTRAGERLDKIAAAACLSEKEISGKLKTVAGII